MKKFKRYLTLLVGWPNTCVVIKNVSIQANNKMVFMRNFQRARTQKLQQLNIKYSRLIKILNVLKLYTQL